MPTTEQQLSPIVFSCYFNASRKGEHFVPDHIFSYQVSGSIIVNDGYREYVFKEGLFRFSKRNQLARYIKLPPPDGVFKTLAIRFDQKILREFSSEYGFTATKKYTGAPFLELTDSPHYRSYAESLIPYLQTGGGLDKQMGPLKFKEGLLLLLKVNPEIKDILFGFSEAGKIWVVEFMNER